MRDYIIRNKEKLKRLLDETGATDRSGSVLVLEEALEKAAAMITERANTRKKAILIGNGASAAMASHIATDLWKNGGVRAIAFNDASGLTCVSNDFGYEHVFEKPLEMFADHGDMLIAISSSGRSENILSAVKRAMENKLKIITLSGFKEDNPLRAMGDINFYVPSDSYGQVEVIHHSICHCLVDITVMVNNGQIQNR